jgi:hypothetical protein
MEIKAGSNSKPGSSMSDCVNQSLEIVSPIVNMKRRQLMFEGEFYQDEPNPETRKLAVTADKISVNISNKDQAGIAENMSDKVTSKKTKLADRADTLSVSVSHKVLAGIAEEMSAPVSDMKT